ncbi:MAG: Rrf2 family transcriptional regulator [Clostridia bacterium]|nr:Rrf2 family transcriptional regulator [Clostridia bacterium]
MKKVSTRGKYGIKAMAELALNYGKGVVSASCLAQKQGISEAYLEQLMSLLKKEGLVESIRGAGGGYMLTREPQQINIGDILFALEGNTSVADCVGRCGESSSCSNTSSCITRPLWLKLQSSIDEVLNTTTLADILNEGKAITDCEENCNDESLS